MSATHIASPLHRSGLSRTLALAVDDGSAQLLQQLLGDDAHATPNLRALVKTTVEGLTLALLRGRFHYPIDAPIYRYHGQACSDDGYPPEIIAETLDATAEAVRDQLLLPCAARLCGVEQPGRVDAGVARLCKVMDDFTREAYRQLLQGFTDTLARRNPAGAGRADETACSSEEAFAAPTDAHREV